MTEIGRTCYEQDSALLRFVQPQDQELSLCGAQLFGLKKAETLVLGLS
jgi:hypothetical protein